MTTGHEHRVVNKLGGDVKLTLEILGVDIDTYINRRDELIYKLNNEGMTHKDLGFKFGMSKSSIGRICRVVRDRITPVDCNNDDVIEIKLAIPKINNMSELWADERSKKIPPDGHLLGALICVKANDQFFRDSVCVNVTGRNESVADWYLVETPDNIRFVNLMRFIWITPPSIVIKITFDLDYETNEVMDITNPLTDCRFEPIDLRPAN